MSGILANVLPNEERFSATEALHVEVIADLACPFCFLGKRRLDTALKAVQGPSEVSWYPWQLNPELPKDGEAYTDFLTQRFGSVENIQPILDGLIKEGANEGIDFRFDKLARVPNTLMAHQLMYQAEVEGKDQSVLADRLMSAFFEHGKDIGDFDVLVGIAREFGIAEVDATLTLFDDASKQVVQHRESQVRASGIAGVPGFLLNRRLLVIGAQEADALVNAFDRAMFGEGTEQILSPALH